VWPKGYKDASINSLLITNWNVNSESVERQNLQKQAREQKNGSETISNSQSCCIKKHFSTWRIPRLDTSKQATAEAEAADTNQ